MLLRCLAFAHTSMELAEAEVVVGDEGAHAEVGGQGQGLTVVSFGVFNLSRIAMRSDLTEESESIGLVSPLPVGASKLEGLLSGRNRVLQSASQ